MGLGQSGGHRRWWWLADVGEGEGAPAMVRGREKKGRESEIVCV